MNHHHHHHHQHMLTGANLYRDVRCSAAVQKEGQSQQAHDCVHITTTTALIIFLSCSARHNLFSLSRLQLACKHNFVAFLFFFYGSLSGVGTSPLTQLNISCCRRHPLRRRTPDCDCSSQLAFLALSCWCCLVVLTLESVCLIDVQMQ